MNVREHFGEIDIYLFDQLLKGRIQPGMRILDAGCGGGRNLVFFLREGYDVYAVDRSPAAVEEVRKLAAGLSPRLQEERFRAEGLEKLSFANDTFDVVICSAVLHFAEDDRHFGEMVGELWRVLKPGGLLFTRLASDIGMEAHVRPLGDGQYLLPDGTQRYLASAAQLHRMTEKLHGQFLEPLKTVQVEGLRCMTTWCVKKPHILFFDPIAEGAAEHAQENDHTDMRENTP
ncbi:MULTISPECIES: class I SAM-dependent methyltransferase [Paenibacillus]|uniref:class I SAM-dependent methyltransferase n=1 Tax=Paenibacillus TaxID=44249 RepID=UPI0022B88E31|nr:class I SAM-dependent methyltransferase [Paenibacillus caseinilyticus]MCZ8521559.1 class I SAM-dependent methyltransferase [Paenibacillus caseinilyticus]